MMKDYIIPPPCCRIDSTGGIAQAPGGSICEASKRHTLRPNKIPINVRSLVHASLPRRCDFIVSVESPPLGAAGCIIHHITNATQGVICCASGASG